MSKRERTIGNGGRGPSGRQQIAAAGPDGHHVRVRGGETQLSDEPFAEIKDQLGGYYIPDCEDLNTTTGSPSSTCPA